MNIWILVNFAKYPQPNLWNMETNYKVSFSPSCNCHYYAHTNSQILNIVDQQFDTKMVIIEVPFFKMFELKNAPSPSSTFIPSPISSTTSVSKNSIVASLQKFIIRLFLFFPEQHFFFLSSPNLITPFFIYHKKCFILCINTLPLI